MSTPKKATKLPTPIENTILQYCETVNQAISLLKKRDRLFRNPKVKEFFEVDKEWHALLARANSVAGTLGHLIGEAHREAAERAEKKHKASVNRRARAH